MRPRNCASIAARSARATAWCGCRTGSFLAIRNSDDPRRADVDEQPSWRAWSGSLAATPASAQARREFVGPGKCTDCHDHKDEKEWSEKRDGDGKGKQHLNALNQLSDAKADAYAKAIGVADVYDPKSTCVACHATVVRGSADFGISCESCHGAGKDYLKPHQEKGAYQASLALGLKDTVKKPEAWLKECVSCHVLGDNPGDAALIKAGHSSGADFDFGMKFQPVAGHWTSKYTANQIAAIGNPLRNALARKAPASAPAAAAAPRRRRRGACAAPRLRLPHRPPRRHTCACRADTGRSARRIGIARRRTSRRRAAAVARAAAGRRRRRRRR